MIDFEPPAVLPGSLKDQLRALAPYMLKLTPKMNGGFVIKMAEAIMLDVRFTSLTRKEYW